LIDSEIGLDLHNAAEDFSQGAIESDFRTPNFVFIPSRATGVEFGPELVPLPSFHQLSYSAPDNVSQYVEQTSHKAMTSRLARKPRESVPPKLQSPG